MILTPKHLVSLLILGFIFIINQTSKFFPEVLPEILTWEVVHFTLLFWVGLVFFSDWIGVRLTGILMGVSVVVMIAYWSVIVYI